MGKSRPRMTGRWRDLIGWCGGHQCAGRPKPRGPHGVSPGLRSRCSGRFARKSDDAARQRSDVLKPRAAAAETDFQGFHSCQAATRTRWTNRALCRAPTIRSSPFRPWLEPRIWMPRFMNGTPEFRTRACTASHCRCPSCRLRCHCSGIHGWMAIQRIIGCGSCVRDACAEPLGAQTLP